MEMIQNKNKEIFANLLKRLVFTFQRKTVLDKSDANEKNLSDLSNCSFEPNFSKSKKVPGFPFLNHFTKMILATKIRWMNR